MDNKGNVTLEIGVIIIILLMVMGIVLSLNEISTEKIVRQSENEHIQTLLEESVVNL